MVLFVFLFVLVHSQQIWQLTSEISPLKFLSSSQVAKRIAPLTCRDNASDFSISLWTWHERLHIRKQFFSLTSASNSLRISKGPERVLSAHLLVNNTEVTLSTVGAAAKEWELVTVVVSSSTQTVKICSATVDAAVPICNSTTLGSSSLSIGSTQSSVILGGGGMEILAARVFFFELSADNIESLAAHEKSHTPASLSEAGLYLPANYNEIACLTWSQSSISRTVAQGLIDTYDFQTGSLGQSTYKLIFDLKVTSGDADLVLNWKGLYPGLWRSSMPGSDWLTLYVHANPFLRDGSSVSVSVAGFADITAYTLSVAVISIKGWNAISAFAEGGIDDPQVDIESTTPLIGPTEVQVTDLGYVLLIAVAILFMLGVCVCMTRRSKDQLNRTHENFVRLDA